MKVSPKWPFPPPDKIPFLWKVTSSVVMAIVGTCSKIWGGWLNTTTVYNKQTLVDAITNRAKGQPLVTVCNHHSCMDDPVLWGMLPWKLMTYQTKMLRWALSAHDVCFTKPLHSWFFSHGQCVPVVRGNGLYQQAINFIVGKLNEGKWVHVYPEGIINESHKPMRIKWGVARMIADSNILPVVIPFWHSGMDSILPNKTPYIPQIGQKVVIVIGEPIQLKDKLAQLNSLAKSPEEIRKAIADCIQTELHKLQIECETLHHGYSKYSNS